MLRHYLQPHSPVASAPVAVKGQYTTLSEAKADRKKSRGITLCSPDPCYDTPKSSPLVPGKHLRPNNNFNLYCPIPINRKSPATNSPSLLPAEATRRAEGARLLRVPPRAAESDSTAEASYISGSTGRQLARNIFICVVNVFRTPQIFFFVAPADRTNRGRGEESEGEGEEQRETGGGGGGEEEGARRQEGDEGRKRKRMEAEGGLEGERLEGGERERGLRGEGGGGAQRVGGSLTRAKGNQGIRE